MMCSFWADGPCYDSFQRAFPDLSRSWNVLVASERPQAPVVELTGELLLAVFQAGFDLRLCHPRHKRSSEVHPVQVVVAAGGRGFGQE